MTWKSMILTIFGLGIVAFVSEHPWIFGAFIAEFAVLIWIGYKLDKAMGIR